jgi:tRNA(Ile)-lysidine synthase
MAYVSEMGRGAVVQRDEAFGVRFREHLAALDLAQAHLLVAVSGGPDSVALLDLLVASREALSLELTVAHVDHGIHPDSAQVAGMVGALAAEYRLPFMARRLALGREASETAARAARYRAIEAMRREAGAGFIATAHHADDQAETVLMRALRGSGPAGLAAMTARRGKLVRPLLPFRRDDLARHLQAIGRSSWADPANRDPKHLRAWIRADILPVLRGRLPDVETRLTRVAEQASIDRRAWDALLETLPGLDLKAEQDGISVASKPLEIADSNVLICITMAAARRCGISLGPARAARVARLLESGQSGAHVPIGGGWIAELAFGRLRLARPGRRSPGRAKPLSGESGTLMWAGWRFTLSSAVAPERQDRLSMTAWFEPVPLGVRSWREGDRIRPLRGRGSRLLVRCFQDARVARSRRAGWPVLESGGSPVWVPGVCRSDRLLPPPGAEALRVDAELV